MKRYLFICSFLVLILNIDISGSCGTASCPLHSKNYFYKGLFSLRLNYEYIHQDQVYIGSERSFIGAIPEHHDEVSTINRITTFSLGYGLTEFLSLDLNIPFIQRNHTHIHNHHGEKIFQNWNFSNIGDLLLTADFSLTLNQEDNRYLNFLAGVEIPTGRTDIENNDSEPADPTLQPGSGSTDFLMGLSYSTDLLTLPSYAGYSVLPANFNVSYKLNTKGTDDFRWGNGLLIHFSTAYRFIGYASLLLQLNGKYQEKAEPGITGENTENTGGKWLFLSPGLKIHLTEALSLSGYFQIPLYQELNGIQLAAPYNLQFSISHEMSLLN